MIASAPDNGFTKEKVPYYFQTPVASSLKSTSLSLSSVVPQPDSPSPSLQFVEEVCNLVICFFVLFCFGFFLFVLVLFWFCFVFVF